MGTCLHERTIHDSQTTLHFRTGLTSVATSISLFDTISVLPGIGHKRARVLSSNEIKTVFDLLRLAPKRYEDRTKLLPLSTIVPDGIARGVFVGRLERIKINYFGRNKCIVWALFSDHSGQARARWFNQPYLAKVLIEGNSYFLFGPAIEFGRRIVLDNPEFESTCDSDSNPIPGSLTPVYPLSAGIKNAKIGQKTLRKILRTAFLKIDWQKSFPNLHENGPFFKIKRSIEKLHWPINLSEAAQARETLDFLDHLLFQMGVLTRKGNFNDVSMSTPSHNLFPKRLPPLPYSLTSDQLTAFQEIATDIDKPIPMNRILQGEVGSGKTIVAFLAMIYTVDRYPERVTTFMAPTEILAKQHFKNFLHYFPNYQSKTVLLTAGQDSLTKRENLRKMASNEASFIFGTHALFQSEVNIPRLGLCIIDEQHKFGVEQRRALVRKATDRPPHLLLISATPIPRTLALTIFGDMKISTIRTIPPGRNKVTTMLCQTLKEALEIAQVHLSKNRQVFIVCPSIHDSDKILLKSVDSTFLSVKAVLPDKRIACLTSENSFEQVEKIMLEFQRGNIDVLIATTIIEVGIDIPNATCMIIENAERFGLSQLHQLRGRISRSSEPAECVVVCRNSAESERLKIFLNNHDGFAIAQEDLRIRGPGDLIGTRQSGLNHRAFQNIHRLDLIEKARKRAIEILTKEEILVRHWFIERMKESFGTAFKDFMEGG